MLVADKGVRATLSRDLKISGVTQQPHEAPHSGDASATAGSMETVMPAGNGLFACPSRSYLCCRSTTNTAAPMAATRSTGVVAQQLLMLTAEYGQLMCELLQWERELRQQLVRHEQEELTQIVWSVEETLSPVMAALRNVHNLSVAQAETVWRWCIRNDYNRFLLDVTQLQEVLHRRSLSFAEEPRCRKMIENAEVPHWIEARRLQMMREAKESAAVENADRARCLAYFAFVQQQLYQIFLLEERERAGRMDVERLQRLYAGALAETRAKEYRHVRLCQLRYEAMYGELRPEVARGLVTEEALHRTRLCHDQALAFKKLKADEIRSYLASSRQELLNSRMEED
ncbi:hypothetical protein GH5_06207 [Leishmania sp. Ghana 2012 LV757]|uniref:hypothetical protein n=1 Tax=Leishmania sp. Ghana 2012 LV757 TaxID=2803181 RepID=UPI001B719AD6|nr:hypothetical protein GH5_06207 [Leishmania sp. Ghana 2012 LV757]